MFLKKVIALRTEEQKDQLAYFMSLVEMDVRLSVGVELVKRPTSIESLMVNMATFNRILSMIGASEYALALEQGKHIGPNKALVVVLYNQIIIHVLHELDLSSLIRGQSPY